MFHKLLQLFYRIIAPNHPRGWLTFHSVESNGSTWVHCHGMEKWNLPNVEFVEVPLELGGYAHGIAMDIVGYLKNEKIIEDREHFGGLLVSENQNVIHRATLHKVNRENDPEHSNTLRVVDYNKDAESGFAYELFAAHLIALSDNTNNLNVRKKLLDKAIEIYPGNKSAESDDITKEFEHGSNKNNYAAYLGIGDYHADTNNFEEAINYFEIAIAKSPSWARQFSNDMRGSTGNSMPIEARQDPRFKYWTELTVENIKEIIEDKK